MKTQFKSFGLAILITVIMLNVLIITGCNGSSSSNPYNGYGWNVWRDSSSTATLNYSIADDGVCTVTVGGTPERQGDGVWNAWKISAQYAYTGSADTSYEYKFEAWTQSGARNLHVQYYENNDDRVYLGETIPITTTRTTYTVTGNVPKSGRTNLSFQLADQVGTVNLKMLEIKEVIQGKLTITNFSGIPNLSQNNYLRGDALNSDSTLGFGAKMHIYNDSYYSEGIQIKGNTITIPVWKVVNSGQYTFVPFLGDLTIEAGYLVLQSYKILPDNNWDYLNYYVNKVPIIFTNGNATINFATQMMVAEEDETVPIEP